MRINYGINRKFKGGIRHENHHTECDKWPALFYMVNFVARVHPGWSLTGYATADK